MYTKIIDNKCVTKLPQPSKTIGEPPKGTSTKLYTIPVTEIHTSTAKDKYERITLFAFKNAIIRNPITTSKFDCTVYERNDAPPANTIRLTVPCSVTIALSSKNILWAITFLFIVQNPLIPLARHLSISHKAHKVYIMPVERKN